MDDSVGNFISLIYTRDSHKSSNDEDLGKENSIFEYNGGDRSQLAENRLSCSEGRIIAMAMGSNCRQEHSMWEIVGTESVNDPSRVEVQAIGHSASVDAVACSG